MLRVRQTLPIASLLPQPSVCASFCQHSCSLPISLSFLGMCAFFESSSAIFSQHAGNSCTVWWSQALAPMAADEIKFYFKPFQHTTGTEQTHYMLKKNTHVGIIIKLHQHYEKPLGVPQTVPYVRIKFSSLTWKIGFIKCELTSSSNSAGRSQLIIFAILRDSGQNKNRHTCTTVFNNDGQFVLEIEKLLIVGSEMC